MTPQTRMVSASMGPARVQQNVSETRIRPLVHGSCPPNGRPDWTTGATALRKVREAPRAVFGPSGSSSVGQAVTERRIVEGSWGHGVPTMSMEEPRPTPSPGDTGGHRGISYLIGRARASSTVMMAVTDRA